MTATSADCGEIRQGMYVAGRSWQIEVTRLYHAGEAIATQVADDAGRPGLLDEHAPDVVNGWGRRRGPVFYRPQDAPKSVAG